MNYDVPNDATFAAVLVFALFAAVLAVIAERTHFFPRAVRWIQKDPVVRTALVALLFAIGPITARTKNGQLSLPRPPLLLQVDEPAPAPAIAPVTVHTNGVALRVESTNAVEITAFRTVGGTELGNWIETAAPFFAIGTQDVSRCYVSASGSISFNSMRRPPVGQMLPDGTGLSVLCPLRAPLGMVPEANWTNANTQSRFWHDALPGGGRVLTWENALVDRLPGRRVTVQTELHPSGDFAYRYVFHDELDPPPTNFVIGAQLGTNGVNALSILETNILAATVWNVDGAPFTNGITINDLLCTNGMLRTPAAFEIRWKNTTGLDPDADTDGDGLTDGDEVFHHDTDPFAPDSDFDGVDDGSEVAAHLQPLARDSDGDGLVDGSDPDPATPTSLADIDGDSIPDAYEAHWFGGTNAVDTADERDDTGFTLAAKLLAGINPTNAPAPPLVASTNSLVSWLLFDGLAMDWPPAATNLVWERTFAIHRTSAWQQFFVSASPTNAAAWHLDGMRLEWETDGGSSGMATASPRNDSFRIPLPSDDLATTLTLRLRATDTSATLLAPQPLHLIAYAPELSFTGGQSVVGQSGTTFHVFTNGSSAQIGLVIDHSSRPCHAAPTAAECDLGDFAMSDAIGPAGGPLDIGRPGFYSIPSPSLAVSSPAPSPSPPRTRSQPGGGIPIVVLDPSVRWECNGHGCGYNGLVYDWATGTYGEELNYPLDSSCLRKKWYRDWSGDWYSGDCWLWVRSGLGDDETGPVYVSSDGDSGSVLVDGVVVWTGSAPHAYGEGGCTAVYDEGFLSDECGGCDADCSDGSCDDLEGPTLGSLRFRIPLGVPGRGQVAGFVWLASDGPVAISRSAFQLLRHPDATVTDTTVGGVRHIVCNDSRCRDLSIEDITGGVRVTILTTASQSLEHTWEITNENGDPARVRLRKISRLNNVMSDETFAYANGDWTRFDNIAGVSTKLVSWDNFSSQGGSIKNETRTTKDAHGHVLAEVTTQFSRIGDCDNAVLRETYRSELTGEGSAHEWSAAEYWDDPSHSARHGQPRLVYGNARPWVYTDFDDDGREILRVEQRGSAIVPLNVPRADSGNITAVANVFPNAFVTVRDYTPLSGDSCHPDDAPHPRTETRYVVRNGVATVIGRTWTRRTRLVRDGLDAVKTETWRAATQDATLDLSTFEPFNFSTSLASSYAIAYTDTGDGTPLLLRGALAESLDEDGIRAVNAYSLADGVLTCTTRRFHGESEFPTYEVTGRDSVHGTLLRRTTRLTAGGTVVADEQSVYDDQNRLRSTTYLDGTSITNAYSCCRLLWTRDREGRKTLRSAQTGTDHLYHAMEDVWLADVSTNGSFRVTQHFFDALGRETNTVVYSGTTPGEAQSPATVAHSPLSIVHSSYPHPGNDCVERTDERGAVTRTVRSILSNAEETVESVRTNGVEVLRTVNRTYLGGGSLVRREWGAGNWAEERRFDDYAPDGKRISYVVTTSSDCGTVTNSVSTYDLLGRLVSEATPLGTTEYAYDGATDRIAQTVFTAGDVLTTTAHLYNDLGEAVGTAAFGVTNRNDVTYETDASNVTWRVTTQRTFCGSTTNALSSIRERLTGLGAECRSCVETRNVLSRAWTRRTTSFHSVTGRSTETAETSAGAVMQTERVKSVPVETHATTGDTYTYHDAFGRVSRVSRAGFPPEENAADILPVEERVYSASGDLVERRSYTNATDYVTETFSFDMLGRLLTTTDAIGNAVASVYDARDNVVATDGATYPLRQSYDAAGRRTSLSTTRDDGATWDTTAWAYDPATGLCLSKTYADGSTISYTYTSDGLPLRTTYANGAWVVCVYDATRREIARHYSDESLNCAFGRDVFGFLTSASNAVALGAVQRDGPGKATNETHTIGGNVRTMARAYDAEGRLSSLEWHGNGDAASRRVDYGYDSEGRIAMATYGLFAAVYSYHGGGYEQGYTLSLPSGATLVRHVVRNAYRTHPIEAVQNFFVTASGVTNALPSFAYALDGLMRPVQRNADEFAYDVRSQLTSATLRSANTNAFAYVYDTAGNRIAASDSGASVAYAANQLNQYEAVAETCPAYDIDGNLLTNGVWSYAWDAANRLAVACSNGVCVVSNAYDALSRRVLKVTPTETCTFLYDGWNMVREEVRDNTTGAIAETRDYYWGRDLSGSLQGAGGVGGLLAYTRNGALRVPVYDHIGNVVAVVDDFGAIVAAYEYDPFGNIVAQSGPEADEVPFRFSTKYFNRETGLYYYGYRFYAPDMGRWINRDPIWEDGGANLYVFSQNAALHNVDYLGKASVRWGDRSRSRRCECIASKRIKTPVSLDRPLSFDMRYPTEFDHIASPETYLGQENWFEQNYSGWLNYAVEFFGKEINDWIKAQCARGSTPAAYNNLTSRISVDPYYGKFKHYIFRVPDPESNETKYGDAPQSRRSAGSILGRFFIDIATPVSISYTKTTSGNTMFTWEAELYFGDTLGTQPEEDGWLLGMFSSVFPSRNVKRAKWTISSGGLCCED